MRPDVIPAGLDDAIERLRLVRSAKAAGMSWAQIGARLGVTAKAAKRGAHLLERDTRRQFLLAAQAVTPGPPYTHTIVPPEPIGWDEDGEPLYPEPGPAFTVTEG